ncbi:uncharacterized protein LOC113366927 [Ctenocephalides felis]|uniref:uncharacterized protein LOC113366927 n=1 Tax=Ctenocephalides felis TaxID=7515 RepID=UPI000E6E4F53|nr:uncharacterized protein LOC113366927 [Ctenocephalides felis]
MTLSVFNFYGSVLGKIGGEIVQLTGEPSFRSVELRWQTTGRNDGSNTNSTSGYSVHYCELQSWGPLRCKDKQHVLLATNTDDRSLNMVDGDYEKSNTDDVSYSMKIGGLRMATTYSFRVKPIRLDQTNRTDRSDDSEDNTIIVPTKGFSARATQCLPLESVVEVSTGPHFGGRISVEPSDAQLDESPVNPDCTINGDPADTRESYTLRIDHTKCGSRVNETTVATFIIVQENLPILTHSTRRFLVLCTFQPEVLTVRAGMNLPPRYPGVGLAETDSPTRRQNNARSLLSKGRAQLVLKSDYDDWTNSDDNITIVKKDKKQQHVDDSLHEPKNVHAARLMDSIPSVDEATPKDITEKSFLSGALILVACGACVSCIIIILRFKLKKRSIAVNDNRPIVFQTL